MAYYNNRTVNGQCGNNTMRNNRTSGCGCSQTVSVSRECPHEMHEHTHSKVDKLPLAMAYVPWQHIGELYPPCKALHEGTAFPELNQIFCGVRG